MSGRCLLKSLPERKQKQRLKNAGDIKEFFGRNLCFHFLLWGDIAMPGKNWEPLPCTAKSNCDKNRPHSPTVPYACRSKQKNLVCCWLQQTFAHVRRRTVGRARSHTEVAVHPGLDATPDPGGQAQLLQLLRRHKLPVAHRQRVLVLRPLLLHLLLVRQPLRQERGFFLN